MSDSNPRRRRRFLLLIGGCVLLTAVGWCALQEGRGHRLLRSAVRDYYALVGDTGGPLTVVDRGGWTELQPGMEIHRVVVTRPRNLSDVELVALRLDPRQFEFGVRMAPGSADEVGLTEGAAAVINGGYFDSKGRPLGLLISGGQQISGSLSRAEGRALFGVRDGVPFVSDAAGVPLEGVSEALQTTPLLVRNGNEVEGFDEPWRVDRRAAVCVDREGHVVFAVTDTLLNGLSFSEMAHLLARSRDRGGLGCRNAMNLDGGTSAQLWIADHVDQSVPGYTDVPVHLLAFPAP